MNLKRIVEILPALAAFFVLLGYLKLYLYYDHWDIPIIDYLDISEITTLFLSDIHIVISFIAIFLFPLTIGLAIIRFVEDRDSRRNAANGIPNDSMPVVQGAAPAQNSGSHMLIFVLMTVCFVVSAIFISLFFAYNKIWLLYFSTFNFMQFALIFAEYIFHEHEKLTMQATFVTTTIAFSVLVSRYDICKTEKTSNLFSETIITTDTTYVTSSNLLYIGKTSKHLFIYDVNSKTSRALKNENIKEIVVTQK